MSVGAVELAECPFQPHPCHCAMCRVCGFGKHMAVHGPVFGQPPGSTPYGHEFAPEDGEPPSPKGDAF